MVPYREVSVVIPAFNEEESIAELVARVRAVSGDFEVIVCSDGSSDRTAELARKAGAVVVEHPYNIGNGAAVKSGALKASREYIVFMDADLQHQPEDIPKLLEHIPTYDMVVAARTKESKTDLQRNIGNLILIHLAQSISGHQIDDLTSGFRAVKKSILLKFMHLYPLSYSYPTTSTLAFFSAGYFVKYVPMPTIVRRTQGQSNIKPFRDGMKFLHIIFRVIMTFHPQKIFLPSFLLLMTLGIAISTYQLVSGGAIQSSGIILLVSAVMIFLNGMLAEQIAQLRRDMNR